MLTLISSLNRDDISGLVYRPTELCNYVLQSVPTWLHKVPHLLSNQKFAAAAIVRETQYSYGTKMQACNALLQGCYPAGDVTVFVDGTCLLSLGQNVLNYGAITDTVLAELECMFDCCLTKQAAAVKLHDFYEQEETEHVSADTTKNDVSDDNDRRFDITEWAKRSEVFKPV